MLLKIIPQSHNQHLAIYNFNSAALLLLCTFRPKMICNWEHSALIVYDIFLHIIKSIVSLLSKYTLFITGLLTLWLQMKALVQLIMLSLCDC